MSANRARTATSIVWTLLALNVPVLLLVTLLGERRLVPFNSVLIMTVLFLFVANVWFLKLRLRRAQPVTAEESRISKGAWAAVGLFTVSEVFGIVGLLMEPSLALGAGVCAGALATGYFWYVLYIMHRRRESNSK